MVSRNPTRFHGRGWLRFGGGPSRRGTEAFGEVGVGTVAGGPRNRAIF